MTLRHWISLAVLGSLAACATQRASEGGTGTSTDWVRHCRLDDDCHGSLVCGCGLCTKPCKSDTACKPLDDQAVCVSAPIQCEVQASYCAPKSDYTFPGAATEEPSANEVQSSQVSAALVQSDAGTGSDQSGAAWRVIEVPALGNEPRVVHTPDGWLALSNRTLGDGKAPSGYDAALYQSADGVHWTRLKLSFVTNDVQVEGLAYGNGTYVIGAR
ncbi:MAG TPA: hypothetical protein VHM70_24615, partial [Polyangiaceae bacterium]|nr:hypothetical protein [Polyangiaceae bacterium]